MTEPLRAEHSVAFSYRRSVGGADERFLRGLARGEVWGSRAADGRVVVPPVDHDAETGAPVEEFVRVADRGVVRSWTWVPSPGPEHPLDHPFAYALVQLDGADTALLHVVDVGREDNMATGRRVHADWRPERVGSVLDIRAFVPDESGPGGRALWCDEPDAVDVATDLSLTYTYEPGPTLSGFLRSLGEGRIEGGRCSSCAKVYVPPRSRCPVCGTGPMVTVAVEGRGTIVSFAVVRVPVPGLVTEPPFAWAWIRLDGADVPFAHLLGETAPGEVQVGQRVEAVWVADGELAPTWESIRYFRLVGAG